MKKCPYCAEEIQDEAILCRYCGRDLLRANDPPKEKKKDSPSVKGAKASAVITVLYLLTLPLTSTGPADLTGKLTIGLIATFIGWWLICTFIIWLWRKLGGGYFLIASALLVIILMFISAGSLSSIASIFVSPTPTPWPSRTPYPTRTPKPTISYPFLSRPSLVSGCNWSYEISRSSLGKNICVQGIVSEIYGNNENSYLQLVFQDSNGFFINDESYYYPNLTVGACVYTTGMLRVNNNGVFFMKIAGNIQLCP